MFRLVELGEDRLDASQEVQARVGQRYCARGPDEKGDAATSFQVEGKLTIRTSLGAIAAAVEGLGIVMTPLGACRRELESGELVRLLAEWDAGTVELNAVYASGRAAKPSARAFVDYLIAAIHETERPPSSPPSIGRKPRRSA